MANSIETKTKESKNLRALIMEAAQEILSDPDFALELGDEAKKRLSIALKTSKQKLVPFSKIKAKFSR